MLTAPTPAVGQSAGHDHGRDVGRADQVEHGLAVAQRRRQDDAVEAVVDQALRMLFLLLAGLALLDEQLHVVEAGLVQQADQEFAQVGGARIAVQEADADRLGAGQVARFLVRRVVQRRHRLGHLAARAFAHQAFAVHDARHRHRRHAGQLGHVGHGRLAAALQVLGGGVWFGFGHVWELPVWRAVRARGDLFAQSYHSRMLANVVLSLVGRERGK
jgi:hypothetical protein